MLPAPAYVHRGGDTPLRWQTVDQAFRATVAAHPEREAVVVVPQAVRCTYRALDARVEACARGLLALGIDAGERVAVFGTNSLEWLVLQLATARVGAVLVNINPAWRAAELADALARAEVHALVLQPGFRRLDYVATLAAACPEVRTSAPGRWRSAALPHLRLAVLFDPDAPGRDAVPPDAPGLVAWPALLARGEAVDAAAMAERAARLDPDDPINIQFTSGTTGRPKAAVLTHHNIVNNGFFVGEQMALTPADRVCVPVPFYHCFGMVVANLAALTHGAALVVPAPHFDAEATLAAVLAERCTVLHGVPTMFIGVLEAHARRGRPATALRTGIMAGAPCPAEVLAGVQQDLGCRDILVGYGQTEASPVTHGTRATDSTARRLHTVGTSLPHQECKVVDPATGRTVAVGASGEVCVRGYQVMRGYYGQPAASAATIDAAGWLHTGDVGALDGDGYLAITGRLKDMIARGGEKIWPAEIEAVYQGHPAVAETAAVGVPDPTMGEEVALFVRLRDGMGATPEALRAWARGRLAHYKIPRHCWIVDAFPLTVTGKVQKFRLRELAQARVAAVR